MLDGDLCLHYRYKDSTYEGNITLHTTAGDTSECVFSGASFAVMLYYVAAHLHAHPAAVLFFHRTDREGLRPIKIDAETTTLLRTDLPAAVRCMTHTVVKEKPPVTDVLIHSQLRVGYDILADAFGDNVYCKMRGRGSHEVECPLCGHWAAINCINTLREVACNYCGFRAACKLVITTRGGWAVFDTNKVIGYAYYHGVEQLFLPRTWNKDRLWIRLTDFQKKYSDYLKDKRDV